MNKNGTIVNDKIKSYSIEDMAFYIGEQRTGTSYDTPLRGAFIFLHTVCYSLFIKYPFMKEFQDFQPSQLVSLLAQETISYYKLIGDDASVEECTHCNNRIRQIEMELDSRRDPQKKNILNRQYQAASSEYSF